MKFENVYFINGTAYAGKSTMVKLLAEKYDGIACEENYQDRLLENLDTKEFPNLTYTRDLQDWGEFVRRTPDEYEAWVNGVTKECTVLEIEILKDLVSRTKKKIFVDTNISVEILHEISDENHVLIMLADPNISVQRFFERPDKEKQFLYQLLLKEDNPEDAMINFRECLKRVNSQERYMMFQKSGFNVITRDENRSIDETFALAESMFGLNDRMKEAGVQNMSAYIRKMAINGYVIIPEWPDLNRVISLHARISNNLNQYAKKANETGKLYEEDIAEIKMMNNEQTELLKKALEAVIHLYEEDSKKRK